MPIYEYNCQKCGHFEIWQPIKDNALNACLQCGSKAERLISANVGFVLKGSGFYQNDFKNTPVIPDKPEKAPPKSTGPEEGCGNCSGPDSCPAGDK